MVVFDGLMGSLGNCSNSHFNIKAVTIFFQFNEISIQVIPEKDLCYIFKCGHPIWAGGKDALIEILKSI